MSQSLSTGSDQNTNARMVPLMWFDPTAYAPSISSLLTELDRRGYYSDNNHYFYDNYFGDQLTMMKVFVL